MAVVERERYRAPSIASPAWILVSVVTLTLANVLIAALIVFAQGLSLPLLGLALRGAVTFVGVLLVVSVSRVRGFAAVGVALSVLVIAGDLVAFRLAPSGSPLTEHVFALIPLFLALRVVRPVTAEDWAFGPRWVALASVGFSLAILTLVPGIGREINEQQISSVLRLNTGEIGRVLILLAIAGAVVGSARAKGSNPLIRALPAFLVIVLIALYWLGKDHGPIGPIVAGFGFAYALRFGRFRHLTGAVLIMATIGIAALVGSGMNERAQSVLSPVNVEAPGENTGQIGSALLAMAWGGVTGTGPGRGLVNHARAPREQATDFALVVIGQEGGIASLLLVLGTLSLLLVWGWRRISRCESAENMVMAGTLWGALTAQVVLVSAGVLSLIPHTGLTLPFVSAGSASILALALVIAAVFSLTQPAEPTTTYGLPAAVVDPPAWWSVAARAGGMALLVMAIVSVGAVVRIEVIAAKVNHDTSNPWVFVDGMRRGLMVATDSARVIQETVHPGALDLIDRIHVPRLNVAGKALRALTGPALGQADLPGLSVTLGDAMRCGGRGQVTLRPEKVVAEAARGDRRQCRPAAVSLTLDPDLVGAADVALRGRPGAVVITEAASGRILAAAGRRVGVASKPAPDVAFLASVPPGSVFKAATGLTVPAGSVAPWRTAYRATDGTVVPGGYCGGTLSQAMGASCNSAFAAWSASAGPERLRAMAKALDMTGQTRTISGLRLSRALMFSTKEPGAGLIAATGIGQGEVVLTPIDAASLAATIANGGVRAAPHLVDGLCQPSGRGLIARMVGRRSRVASPAAASRVNIAMRAPLETMLTSLRAYPSIVGAKTGTAEIPARQDLQTPAGNVAWTIAIVSPPQGPKLAVSAMILPTAEHPRPRGADDAAPLIARLAEAISRYSSQPRRTLCAAS